MNFALYSRNLRGLFMSLSMLEQYDALLKQFVHDNMELLLANRRYKDPKEGSSESNLDYLPAHDDKPDSNFIRETQQFKDLVGQFVDTFIIRDDLIFKMQGHMAALDNKSIKEVVETVDYYDRDNLIFEYEMKLLMDVFSAFLGVRDNKPHRYFVFSYGNHKIEFQSSQRCPACNEYISMIINYDQMAVVPLVKKQDCPLANAPTNIVITLKSPSGKLVFLNDPRKFLKIERDNRYAVSINSTLGCIQETEFYASHNVGFFFVGNSSPHIFQNDNDIVICSDYDDDEEVSLVSSDYAEVGYICTDLWWYTVMDHQLFIELCLASNVDPESIDYTVATTNKNSFTVDHDLTVHTEGYYWGIYSKITY